MPTHLWYFVIAVQATVQEELDFLILWNPLRYKFFCAVHVKGSFNPSWRFMMFTVPVPLHSQPSLEAFCGSPAIAYLGFLTVNTNRNIALIFILIFLYILSYTVPEDFGGGVEGVVCCLFCSLLRTLSTNDHVTFKYTVYWPPFFCVWLSPSSVQRQGPWGHCQTEVLGAGVKTAASICFTGVIRKHGR